MTWTERRFFASRECGHLLQGRLNTASNSFEFDLSSDCQECSTEALPVVGWVLLNEVAS